MKYLGKLLILLVAAAMLAGCSNGKVAAASQTTCPVMGGAINKSLYYDHYTTNEEGVKGEGKRIYYCCPGCLDTIKAAPEKMVHYLEAQGVTLEKVSACSSTETSAECCSQKECKMEGSCPKEGDCQKECPKQGECQKECPKKDAGPEKDTA